MQRGLPPRPARDPYRRRSNARRIPRLRPRSIRALPAPPECAETCGDVGIAVGVGHQNCHAAQTLALLRARRERPCSHGAAHQCDKLAAPHSITSSARAMSFGGTVRPSLFAVLRLMTNSNLV